MSNIQSITKNIVRKSQKTRARYLSMIEQMQNKPLARDRLSCSNWAHVVAVHSDEEKKSMPQNQSANIGIVSAYNDMLSAHQPYAQYPAQIKLIARELGATAQVAGGVPAMCDGVTQGQPGMELSLFSRDVIAMATAVSLSHDVYDAVACLGVCDKIAPGLLIGALQFGHLPILFIPSGPMPSGMPNKEKAKMREKFAKGDIDKKRLLETESQAYHSPGTCTFYGTANTNQVVLEALGVQVAGASFVNPNTPLRKALTEYAVTSLLDQTQKADTYRPLADVVTEYSVVNAIVAMMATGGSTNLTLHLIAMAKSAGIVIDWQDMDAISRITPLLAKVYPNGQADVNDFAHAGSLACVLHQLRQKELLNEHVVNVMGEGLDAYTKTPYICDKKNQLQWTNQAAKSLDKSIIADIDNPFASEGGMRMVKGLLGSAVVKVSAVDVKFHHIKAPCKVFSSQEEFVEAFKANQLNCDHVAVLRFQGPAANGMPELHKLTPYLAILQDQGFNVALLTDGRMSGASGKVLSAIHLSPEAKKSGLIAYLEEGDIIEINAKTGELNVDVEEQALIAREIATAPEQQTSLGRGLFQNMHALIGDSMQGASFLGEGDK